MMYIFLDSFFRTCFTIFSVFFCFWIVRHTFLPIYSICFCLFVCLFFAVRVPATALGFWRSRVDVKALFFIVIQLMKKIDNVKMRFFEEKKILRFVTIVRYLFSCTKVGSLGILLVLTTMYMQEILLFVGLWLCGFLV